MKSKIIIRYFTIFLSIFAIALISSTLLVPHNRNQELSIDNSGDSEQELITPPKLSNFWNNFTYIHIFDNWTNAVNWGWCKGNGSWSNPYVLENITINAASSPTGNGISIQNSVNDYFIIRNCSIMNAPFKSSLGGAILIHNSNNGTVIDNNFTQNYLDIHLHTAENMTVIGNHITGTGIGLGINIDFFSSNNYILNNIVKNKYYYSILIQSSSNNNIIKGNSFIENIGGSGYGSGIHIENSDENNISYNILSNNKNGIKLENSAVTNIIHSNIITQNLNYGAVILNTYTDCLDNLFYNNTFNNPNSGAVNAYDNGTNTQWYLGFLGNRWHDYAGKDANDDGIGDIPYYIQGTGHGVDRYPIFDDGPESDDDDDDNSKTKKSPMIPGYSSALIIIICFTITGIFIIQYRKRMNL